MRRGTMFAAVVAAAFCVAMASSSSFAEAKSVTFSCSGYSGTTTLTNFQALVKLSDGAYGFRYSDCAANDGSDLWFTDSNDNLIPHEVDSWNTSGDSFVWVRVPKVTPLTEGIAEITMHYGETRTAAQTCIATDTWNGHVGVWHMGAATKSETEPDATGNAMNAVPNASSFSNNKGNLDKMIADVNGMVGGCRVNATDNNTGNALKVPSYNGKLDDFNTFAVSGWFYQTMTLSGVFRLFCSRAATTSSSAVYNGWELTTPDTSAIPSGVTDTGSTYSDCYIAAFRRTAIYVDWVCCHSKEVPRASI